MFKITDDKTIHLTRGDVATIFVSAALDGEGEHTFSVGDIVRFRIVQKKDYSNVVRQKDVEVNIETSTVTVSLTKEDTKIGEIINKPVDYWYEVELNPDTDPHTLIGHDETGAKIFRLYPEGSDLI